MIDSITIENYGCFKEPIHLNFFDVNKSRKKINKISCFVGNNASGKSTALRYLHENHGVQYAFNDVVLNENLSFPQPPLISILKNNRVRLAIVKILKRLDLGILDLQVSNNDLLIKLGMEESFYWENFDKVSGATKRTIYFLVTVFLLLKNGGLYLWDNSELSLHPLLLLELIKIAKEKGTHKNFQLIFSCLNVHVMSKDALHDYYINPQEIFIFHVDHKTREREVYNLSEMRGVKNNENFGLHYLAGSYGGLPTIRWVRP